MIEFVKEEYCNNCEQWVPATNFKNGYCLTCRPRCGLPACVGLLISQTKDAGICGSCGEIHLLDKKGNWIPESVRVQKDKEQIEKMRAEGK